MSNKRGIGLTVLVCIITSVLTSLLTIVVMKNNIGDTNQNSVSKEIVVNDSGKSQNIYHAVSDKAMPSVVGITTTTISNNNKNPGLAQLVARLLWEQDVGSSSLPSRTTAPEIE